jgi:RNA polymerase sigma-70 factor (ECF subfamily)
MKAFRGIRKLKDPGAVRPWLYRIAHGIAVDGIRRDTSRERAEEVHSQSFEPAAEPSFGIEDAGAVHSALNELDPGHREVLVLYFLEEFSLAEISRIAGCPEGTVKSRLYYARQAMKTILLRGGYGKSI